MKTREVMKVLLEDWQNNQHHLKGSGIKHRTAVLRFKATLLELREECTNGEDKRFITGIINSLDNDSYFIVVLDMLMRLKLQGVDL